MIYNRIYMYSPDIVLVVVVDIIVSLILTVPLYTIAGTVVSPIPSYTVILYTPVGGDTMTFDPTGGCVPGVWPIVISQECPVYTSVNTTIHCSTVLSVVIAYVHCSNILPLDRWDSEKS